MEPTRPLATALPPASPAARRWGWLYWAVPFVSRMDRYVLREMIAPFCAGVLFFVVVLTGHYFYWAIKSIGRGVPARDALLMVVYLMPSAAVLSIPIGMILATSVTLNRMGREMELIALRASGVSVQRVVTPFVIVAALVSVGDFYLNDRVAPVTNRRANEILQRLLVVNPTPLVEPDKFFKVGNDFYFYVREVDRATATLRGVLIYRKDPRNWAFPQVITAQWGQKDPTSNRWVFHNVVVHTYGRKGNLLVHTERPMRQLVLNLHENLQEFWADQRQPFELSVQELKDRIAVFEKGGMDAYSFKVAYHFKFAVPAATIVMTLWAAPLSIRFARSGSFAGLFIAVLGVFLYQGAMGWSEVVGEKYRIAPFLVAWSQNFLFGLMGVWLLWRAR
ncbi:hypothetical protein HRbin17_00751 [bacterium HR17]|uniref:Lipopolysaccharide export system permease protein LptG n=1 Tax=Candidatus Fervidibacter japonicus TaxID=2035412 RepID=A0A2H5XAN0_9BACT|nr:hypothetical protein HRbin17_00751 [bacterium HR17]